MAVERISVRLPPGFDPRKHGAALVKKIAETYGEGFEIDSIDPNSNTAQASRQVAITEVSNDTRAGSTKEVNLAAGTKPADGDKMAAKLEGANPGYMMTTFSPFTGKAILTKLDEPTARCRAAVSAAMGVKPWMVQVKPRPDGGFDLELPTSYSPSKHDKKLDEVATSAVGNDGWYVHVDVQKLTASIIPSDPPTFPSLIPYPIHKLGTGNLDFLPFGESLPLPGQTTGEEVGIDWVSQAFMLLGGTPGSGKSVTLNACIAGALSEGAELAIVDIPAKAQPLTTRIPVPISEKFKDGWALLGDLEAGDVVFASDGSQTEVTGLSPITSGDVYEVEFSDRQVIRADGGHLWPVVSRNDRARLSASYRRGREASATIARTRLAERLTHLRSRAAGAALVKKWSNTADLAMLIERKVDYARQLVRRMNLPHVNVPTHGRVTERLYPVDEFLSAYAAILERDADQRVSAMPSFSLQTTADMAKNLHVGRRQLTNYAVPISAAIDCPAAPLPIPPYILGVWLGDGTANTGQVTSGLNDAFEMANHLAGEWGHPVRLLKGRTGSTVQIALPRPNDHLCPYGHDDFRVETKGTRTCRACLRKGGRSGPKNESLYSILQREGLRSNKHIPAAYLRSSVAQRLALLQGLMDSDGTIDATGYCSFTAVSDVLAEGLIELCRSLGIAPSLSKTRTSLTEDDGCGGRRVRRIGFANMVQFATDLPVFRLQRKADILDAKTSVTSKYRFIVDIRPVETELVRCLRVAHPEHLYLTEGFVPTHNSVDFLWCKQYVRPGGWGCDSAEAAVAVLAMVYQEGQMRAKRLAAAGVVNWLDLPPGQRFAPLFVVVDEVSGLLVTDKVPSGIPKDHPLVVEVAQSNLLKVALASYINKIVAELRFVGVRMILSTQVSNNNTGVSPSLKAKIGHKILQGSNPSKSARMQAFNDETAVPQVPAIVRANAKVAKGVGVAEMEGSEPVVYKSWFAPIDSYAAALEKLHIPTTTSPAPTAAQIAEHTPSLDPEGGPVTTTHGKPAREMRNDGTGAEWMTGEDGQVLSGFEKANAARHSATVAAKG